MDRVSDGCRTRIKGGTEDLPLDADAIGELLKFVDLNACGGLLEIFVNDEEQAAVEGGEDGDMADVVLENGPGFVAPRAGEFSVVE